MPHKSRLPTIWNKPNNNEEANPPRLWSCNDPPNVLPCPFETDCIQTCWKHAAAECRQGNRWRVGRSRRDQDTRLRHLLNRFGSAHVLPVRVRHTRRFRIMAVDAARCSKQVATPDEWTRRGLPIGTGPISRLWQYVQLRKLFKRKHLLNSIVYRLWPT